MKDAVVFHTKIIYKNIRGRTKSVTHAVVFHIKIIYKNIPTSLNPDR